MSRRELLRKQAVRQGALLALMLLITQLLPTRAPGGIYALGVIAGLPIALQAIGIVLVYRSNRIINFAQIPIGAFGAYIFQASVTYRPGLRWFRVFCGNGGQCGATAVTVNYWVSFAVGIILPVAVAGLVYLLVVRRFANAPRLLLTVGTIFVGPALYGFFKYVYGWFTTGEQRERDIRLGANDAGALPIHGSFELGGAKFHAIDVVTLAASLVVVGCVIAYLRYSRSGLAVRSAAENADRASTLGIDVSGVTVRIWLLAGLLAGIASVLTATVASGVTGSGDAHVLMPILTAAAIAGLTSLPIAFAAAVVLGVVKHAVLWWSGNEVAMTGSLLFVLALTFVLQHSTANRGEIELASTLATGREARPVPRELARMPAVVGWRRGLVIALLVAVLGVPLLLDAAQIDQLTTVYALSIVVVSLIVLTGWAGQISLGQIGFAGVGAWVTAAVGLPIYVALPLGVVAGAAAAAVVGLPALRLRGLHLAIISIAFALTVSDLVIDPSYGGKALPLHFERPKPFGISLENEKVFYYLVLVALVLTVLAVMGLRRSRIARGLIAARDNEVAAQSLGINLLRARLMAFAVSGGLAAFGGAVLAYQQHAVRTATFDASLGISFFQAAVVGGMGHVSGPLLGSGLVVFPSIFALPDILTTIATGPGPLAIVLLVPGGISQAFFTARDNMLRRLARREGIHVPSLDGLSRGDDDVRAPLLPRSEVTGGQTYVPARYRLEHQWALDVDDDTAEQVMTR